MSAPATIRRGSLLGPRMKREENLRKALQLVRDALDSDAGMGTEDIARLHAAEDLLSLELGNPIWEGRGPLDQWGRQP